MRLFLAAKHRYPGSEVNGSSRNWSGHFFNSNAVLQAHSCDCLSFRGRACVFGHCHSHSVPQYTRASGCCWGWVPPLRRNCQFGDGDRRATEDVEPSAVSPAQRVTKAGLQWYCHQCEKNKDSVIFYVLRLETAFSWEELSFSVKL